MFGKNKKIERVYVAQMCGGTIMFFPDPADGMSSAAIMLGEGLVDEVITVRSNDIAEKLLERHLQLKKEGNKKHDVLSDQNTEIINEDKGSTTTKVEAPSKIDESKKENVDRVSYHNIEWNVRYEDDKLIGEKAAEVSDIIKRHKNKPPRQIAAIIHQQISDVKIHHTTICAYVRFLGKRKYTSPKISEAPISPAVSEIILKYMDNKTYGEMRDIIKKECGVHIHHKRIEYYIKRVRSWSKDGERLEQERQKQSEIDITQDIVKTEEHEEEDQNGPLLIDTLVAPLPPATGG